MKTSSTFVLNRSGRRCRLDCPRLHGARIVDTPAGAQAQGRPDVPIMRAPSGGGRWVAVAALSTDHFFALASDVGDPAFGTGL